jgi:cysteine desulfurase
VNRPGTYLDYNATSPVKPAVRHAILRALEEGGNPSSIHGPGRKARVRLDEARDAVAALVGACAENVIFTSGGTEANNLAILGLTRTHAIETILVSAIEHPCVRTAAEESSIQLREVPVDKNGVLELTALKEMLDHGNGCVLLALMLANNETGVIQPLAAASEYVHAVGGLVHCDAVQAAGKIPFSIADLGVDSLALSAHKFGGPQGAGALVLAHALPLGARLLGGGQELGRRGGTENLPGIVGLGEAAQLAMADLPDYSRLAALRDDFEMRLRQETPAIVIFGEAAPRLPNTSAFAAPGVEADTLLMALDLAGIAVSSGSACSSGKVSHSHVLKAMAVPDSLARSALRVSLGWASREGDLDYFIASWRQIRAQADRARRAVPLAG